MRLVVLDEAGLAWLQWCSVFFLGLLPPTLKAQPASSLLRQWTPQSARLAHPRAGRLSSETQRGSLLP